MGAVAGSLADLCVVTSDNPRTEEPEAILRDVSGGHGRGRGSASGGARPPRGLRLALAQAGPGDVVVLAGKGHETYQEIDGVQRHLDEREEVAAYFSK
jgi:UDP-N-acetylmuramoyl-L-alanyl-D-glutamate--2,6-diaminopimelate ligase